MNLWHTKEFDHAEVVVHVLECELSKSDLMLYSTELIAELSIVRSYRGKTCS